MPTATYGASLSVGGVSINKSIIRTADHPNTYEVSLPAAEAGTLSTRTSDTVGTITMSSGGHTIQTADTIDIFWSGGVRYGVTVGTVSGTSVPFSLGAGDNLPAQSTAVTVDEQVTVNTQIDGDAIAIIGIVMENPDSAATSNGHIDMRDAGGATIEEIDLTANVPQIWDITGGAANVFTGNAITNTKAGNGDATNAMTLKILSLEDSTP